MKLSTTISICLLLSIPYSQTSEIEFQLDSTNQLQQLLGGAKGTNQMDSDDERDEEEKIKNPTEIKYETLGQLLLTGKIYDLEKFSDDFELSQADIKFKKDIQSHPVTSHKICLTCYIYKILTDFSLELANKELLIMKFFNQHRAKRINFQKIDDYKLPRLNDIGKNFDAIKNLIQEKPKASNLMNLLIKQDAENLLSNTFASTQWLFFSYFSFK
ncbi:MAG: hypothetical protein UR26_C0003G0023 [candidate division TM6 bacterium GW2011_GWF2_32_72]|nr:MAG: hypothetical protein UR26_C0003G0023 [candidate division TM6 bacterium GW2011_GWF2_32_72]